MPEREPQAWTKEELQRLFEAIEKTTGWIEGVRAKAWWKALVMVIWSTGERINAVLQLRWELIDLKGRFIYVPAELRKGNRKDKVFKITTETVTATS